MHESTDPKPAAKVESRPWRSFFSLAAALGASCGGLGTLITGLDGRAVGRTGGFGVWRPGWCQLIGVFAVCTVTVAGLYFAFLARRNAERPRTLFILGFIGNGIALCSFLLVGISISDDLILTARNKADSEKSEEFTKQKREQDRKDLRLRLVHQQPPDWLRLTHVTWKDPDTFHAYQNVGTPGEMTLGTLPPGFTIQVTWPKPRQFEMTIEMDTKETNLKLEVVNIQDVTAEGDQKPMALPIELPSGKHRLVLKGAVPDGRLR